MHRLVTISAAGLVAATPLLTGSTGTTLSASAAGVSSPIRAATGSSSIGLWAADWAPNAVSRSAAAWQAAAQNDSVLVGMPGAYKKWIAPLHAWNPKLTILMYNLGPYLQQGSADYTAILQQHPDWFAHDVKGHLINLPAFPGNYLTEASNPGYRAWHSQQLAARVATYGFDGAMDDSMGTGPVGTYSSGTPIDPATGQPYSAAQYLANIVLMLNSDKAALGGRYLAFNGLISGQVYVKDTGVLASSNADAGVSELFVRQAMWPVIQYPTQVQLNDSLQMMSDMAAHGKTFLGWTKVWATGSPAQVSQWEMFDLGVYLLGQQQGSYLDFMPSKNADNTTVAYSNMQSSLGAPLAPYQVQGSVFTRTFQNGVVTVNLGTHTATIT